MDIEKKVAEQLEEIGRKMEETVDQELSKLDALQIDDIQSIREDIQKKRKARMEQEKKWRELGHGSYDEIPDELAFFNTCKRSERVICHFYREATERCKIVDKHLKLLAPKHLEAKFCKIDAEKSPFLCTRLQIRVMPTILLLKNNISVDRVVGFSELGNRDDFKTEMMEWRLSVRDILEYDGDKQTPPEHSMPPERKRTNIIRSRNLRRGGNDSSDEDEESDS